MFGWHWCAKSRASPLASTTRIGYVSPQPGAETYLLVANPSDTPANVAFTIGWPRACVRAVTVPAHSRLTRGIKNDLLCDPLQITGPVAFGGTVESDGPGIVVERSTYWSTPGQFWSAVASTLLTRIQ